GGEPLLAAGPFLGFAAGLAGEVGVEGLDFFVILLRRGQPGRRFRDLLLERGLFLRERRLAALPVLLERLDLGEERRALVTEALEFRLGLVQVGALLAGFFQLALQQLAIGFLLRPDALCSRPQAGET